MRSSSGTAATMSTIRSYGRMVARHVLHVGALLEALVRPLPLSHTRHTPPLPPLPHSPPYPLYPLRTGGREGDRRSGGRAGGQLRAHPFPLAPPRALLAPTAPTGTRWRGIAGCALVRRAPTNGAVDAREALLLRGPPAWATALHGGNVHRKQACHTDNGCSVAPDMCSTLQTSRGCT